MKIRSALQLITTVIVTTLASLQAHAQLTNTQTQYPYCIGHGVDIRYTNWIYTDSYGAHPFTGSSDTFTGAPAICNAYSTSFTSWSTDGLGYYLSATGGNG